MRALVRAFIVVCLCAAGQASAIFHLWTINELYSNAAGNIQYLELTATSGGQQFLNGHTLTSSDGTATHTFTFASNLPGDTDGRRMLVGTVSFANLGVVTPDYIVPDGFFFTGNFTINFAESSDVWSNSSGAMTVPTDGVLSLARNGTTALNSPLNFANQTKAILPLPLQTDLNGDGRSDLLWRNVSTGQVYRMLMNGFTIASQGQAYFEPNTSWLIVADADFNGDGVNDLLWRNFQTGQVYLMPFNTSGLPVAGQVIYTEPSSSWRILHTPDLDGDGKADILWWNLSTGQVYAMLMNGFTIVAQGLVNTEPDLFWRIVAVGDFAGSGKVNQLLWHNLQTGHVYLMTVSFSGGLFGQTGQFIYHEADTAWRIAGAADFNGDLKTDILWRNLGTGQVYVMLMNGPAIAAAGVVHTEPSSNWQIVAQGDYDGDFKADLLWKNFATGEVFMMRMNGLSVAAGQVVYQEASTSWQLLGPFAYYNLAIGD